MARRPRIVFRVASGPRRGYGHVVRALRLAAVMDAQVWMSVDGPTPSWKGRRGIVTRTRGVRVLDAVRPHLLIVDTPLASDGRRWVAAAKRRGIATASIHDGGLAPLATDLAVDGSLAAAGPIRGAHRSLTGPDFMVVDPAVVETPRVASARRVVIALGGGSRAHLARRIADRLLQRSPDLQVAIAAGFGTHARQTPRITWIGQRRSLAAVLAAAEIVVVAGGITLYEAAALGVPAVAVAIVPSQRPTVRAFARAGAALGVAVGSRVDEVAAQAALLLSDADMAATLAARGRRLVDGGGTARVAGLLARLARTAA